MRYWDASAIISLLLTEPGSPGVRNLIKDDRAVISWWGTPVECLSALSRRRRKGDFGDSTWRILLHRLDHLMLEIDLVEPVVALRERALRLVTLHPLSAGDAFQLAAALRWAQDQTRGAGFVCLDERLRKAAQAEGFDVCPL